MTTAPTVQHSGIMSWVSTIRMTMANDPGRQFLEDQIQSNGFLFLEDYLDNILAGPKHDPIIELVKTPGRKKDVPKKTRAATAAANKAKAVMALSLEDDDDFDKENHAPSPSAAPINGFHQALLKARDVDPDVGLLQYEVPHKQKTSFDDSKTAGNAKALAITTPEPRVRVQEPLGAEEDEEEALAVEELVTPPHLKPQSIEEIEPNRLPAPPFHLEHTKELSMIEEDDELAERSDAALEPHIAPSNTQCVRNDTEYTGTVEGKDSIVQSAANRPKGNQFTDVDIPPQSAGLSHSPSQATRKEPPAHVSEQQASQLPHSSHQEDTTDFRTLPHPAQTHTDDENEDDTLERKFRLKTALPHLPSIGAPSPVRMSMRATKESSNATSHNVVGSSLTRSSWLVKAKEAKAIEENIKRISGLPGIGKLAVQTSTSSKRKSGEMLGLTATGGQVPDSTERKQKVSKVAEETSAPVPSKDQGQELNLIQPQPQPQPSADMLDEEHADMDETSLQNREGMMDKLRKTVAGFSARAGKSMGKSLGGAAATALAEARAAAEAKIAERYAAEGLTRVVTAAAAPTAPSAEVKEPTTIFSRPSTENIGPVAPSPTSRESDRRLSVSDLVTQYESKKEVETQEPVFKAPPLAPQPPPTSRLSSALADISTSTTPPNSPPRTRQSVFSLEKPSGASAPSVFAPPPQLAPQPPSHAKTLSAFESRIFNVLQPQPLSNHSTLISTQSSIFSDGIFDHTPLTWGTSTQDTELFEDPAASQQDQYKVFSARSANQDADVEADESWHLDGKFTETWTPNINMHIQKDDMTWNSTHSRSTNDTDSQRLDISVPPPGNKAQLITNLSKSDASHPYEMEELAEEDDDMDVEDDEDLGAIRLVSSASQSTTNLISQSKTHSRPESQRSQQSSTNGSSQLGFFSSATKFVSSVLGGSRKKAEPVKSLQLAAAAAKKQQEEAGRKAARLKDMETRRQQALQKKAEEDKAREEKRKREENERWRREREKDDTTEKRLLKQPGKKLTQMEDDLAKKELTKVERDVKKPPSKDKDLVPTKPGMNASQTVLNVSNGPSKPSKLNAWANSSTTTNFKMADMTIDAKSTLASSTSAASSKLKGKGKAIDDINDKQPAKVMQAQMQARVQAQIKEAKKDSPRIASEKIELPEIQSEYSDSDDEDRRKGLPQWVQSPELHAALRQQSTIDPDDIFGAIKPLKMEELFKTRTSRFRARTSSANWAGTDEVTAAEEREYARRMGYTK